MTKKSFLCLLALFFLLWASPGFPVIAVDSTSENSVTCAVSSTSWSHTVNTADNTILIVGSMIRGATAGNLPITGITYNAVALTKIRDDDDGVRRTELWYLFAPATGSNTVAVTYTGSISNNIAAFGISMTGVQQSAQPDAENGDTSGATPSTSVTTVADNSFIIDAYYDIEDPGPLTVGSGQTVISNRAVNCAVGPDSAGGSREGPVTPVGATTMDWTGGNTDHAHSAASFSPAVAAGVQGIIGGSIIITP